MTIEDIALTMTPGIGVKGAVHLLETFGDARRIFAATAAELTDQARLRPDIAQQLLHRKGFSPAEKELTHCARHDIQIIASSDPGYPPLLREIPDYPHVLYVKGDAAALRSRCVSIVGTRASTPNYGMPMCNRLVEGLAAKVPGLCIVSGLAFGIDITAHRAALAAGIQTVAVLANPLPGVTPTEHLGVARDLVAHGGALVTELHSQVKQNGNFYLDRNRMIAGLSAGTVVIESKYAGGSLVTARYADSYNRTVMAVPGRVGDPASAGTNHLIYTRKAQMIRSAGDIIEELGWDQQFNDLRQQPKAAATELTPNEKALLNCFTGTDPVSVETLGEQSGLDFKELQIQLTMLELSGAIRQLPGNLYLRLTDKP